MLAPGRDLARLRGWHPSKSSRIMNARTPPFADDMRAWCRACGAAGQTDDPIAFLQAFSVGSVKPRLRIGLRSWAAALTSASNDASDRSMARRQASRSAARARCSQVRGPPG
ncbi:helix-turn-helix domain-containing protein [Streptomyces spiralis]